MVGIALAIAESQSTSTFDWSLIIAPVAALAGAALTAVIGFRRLGMEVASREHGTLRDARLQAYTEFAVASLDYASHYPKQFLGQEHDPDAWRETVADYNRSAMTVSLVGSPDVRAAANRLATLIGEENNRIADAARSGQLTIKLELDPDVRGAHTAFIDVSRQDIHRMFATTLNPALQ